MLFQHDLRMFQKTFLCFNRSRTSDLLYKGINAVKEFLQIRLADDPNWLTMHSRFELMTFEPLLLSFCVQTDPWNTHVWKGVNGTPTKKRAIGFKKLAK